MKNTIEITYEPPKFAQEVLEKCGLRWWEGSLEDGKVFFELSGYTDAGGEMIHQLYVPKDELDSVSAWREAIFDVWEGFDPWHETFIWCDEDGVPQRTPFTRGIDLYHDCERYDENTLHKAYKMMLEIWMETVRP